MQVRPLSRSSFSLRFLPYFFWTPNTHACRRPDPVMDAQNILGFPPVLNGTVTNPQGPIHHILSGSFRSLSLFLLAFSPSTGSLSHLQTIPAFGPHQYLATNQFRDRVYATTWAEPPSLSSWHVHRSNPDPWRVSLINTVPISRCQTCFKNSRFR